MLSLLIYIYAENGVYTLHDTYYFYDINHEYNAFHADCMAVENGDIEVYELLEE